MAWNYNHAGLVGTGGPVMTPVYTTPIAPSPANLGIVWVESKEEAQNYPVAAGNSIMLMDKNDSTMYLKSTDVSGRPFPMEIYDLIKREQQPDPNDYVKKDDLEKIVAEAVNKAFTNRPRRNNYRRNDDRRSQEGVNENG